MNKPDIDKNLEVLLTQYKEVYESHRMHDRFIWQMLTVGLAVISGLVIGAYRFIDGYARITILFIGAAIMFILAIISQKHRYFNSIEQDTLLKIEGELKKYGGKYIQRSTTPESKLKSNFWVSEEEPRKPEKLSAHYLQIATFIFTAFILFFLAIMEIIGYCFFMKIFSIVSSAVISVVYYKKYRKRTHSKRFAPKMDF